MSDPTIAEYDRCLHQACDENDALRAELGQVKAENKTLLLRLEALTTALNDERGTLGVLQVMAHDQTLPPGLRIKAAAAAVQFERAKPASANGTVNINLFDLLETKRRMRAKEARTIEHDPAPPAA